MSASSDLLSHSPSLPLTRTHTHVSTELFCARHRLGTGDPEVSKAGSNLYPGGKHLAGAELAKTNTFVHQMAARALEKS